MRSIRDVHTELARLAPYRDDGLVPKPSASEDQVEATEARLGVRLPTAYRQWLLHSNGWTRFFEGANLLGTEELGTKELSLASQELLKAATASSLPQDRFTVTFGVDAARCTLFAFDYTRGGREPAVIAWVQELGMTFDNFTHFLEFVLTVARAELARFRTEPANEQKHRATHAA